MFTDEDVNVVADRFKVWSNVFGGLADQQACRRLLTVLDEADGKGLHKLVDGWKLPGEVGCIEIVETMTNSSTPATGRRSRRAQSSTSFDHCTPARRKVSAVELPDGSVLWLTEAEWWQMMDRAVNDEAWQATRTTGCWLPWASSSARSNWSRPSSASTSTSDTRSAPRPGTRECADPDRG